jgi:hypothetical protein
MWVLLPGHICNEYTDQPIPTHLSVFLLVINRSLAVLTDYRISREQSTTGKDQPARYVLSSDQWSKINERLKWLNLKNY